MIPLVGECEARVRLFKQLGEECLSFNLTTASQQEIQSHINRRILSSIKEKVSVRERARLKTVASSHSVIGCGNAQPTTWPQHVSTRVCACDKNTVGTLFFHSLLTKSLKCTCGTIFDRHGDHFLSCGHVQLRIKRHDYLYDIIYHELLTDNKNIKREQCFSGM